MQNPKRRDEDRELAEWLQQTVRELRGSALPLDEPAEDPFSDPAVRHRVAALISRSVDKP